MTARVSAAVLLVALGGVGALAVTTAQAGDPALTVTTTQTVTRTVEGRYQGWTARTWARHAAQARRDANARGHVIRRLRRVQARRYTPTVRYAIALSRAVYGVDLTRRTYCESRNDPFAVEGHGPVGLLQFFPSTWRTTPFRAFPIFDPVAQELAGGWMWAHGRSGEWSCHL